MSHSRGCRGVRAKEHVTRPDSRQPKTNCRSVWDIMGGWAVVRYNLYHQVTWKTSRVNLDQFLLHASGQAVMAGTKSIGAGRRDRLS